MTKDNNLLGTFNLEGIPPAPRGVPQIEVTFNLDANGILNVTAQDKSTGKSKNIQIRNERGRLSQAEIDRMLNDAKKYEAEDRAERERIESRNKCEAYAFQVKQSLQEYGDKLPADDRQRAQDACDQTLRWLDSNQTAEKSEYEHQYKELESTCSKILAKLHQQGQQGQQGQQMPGGATCDLSFFN
ncbi:hypothetical protein M3Y97_01003200 [Aphelenchoides bicaudatus]|nr:hypothetical protein M3Y97_01003200 [Aphelenchoides bicaudatus]